MQRLIRLGEILEFTIFERVEGKSKHEVIQEARVNGKQVHFATLMDFCHLKRPELAEHLQKYQGRVVPTGDDVKDDGEPCSLNKEHHPLI